MTTPRQEGLTAYVGMFGRRAPIMLLRKAIEVGSGLAIFAVLARELSQEAFATYSLVLAVIGIFRATALPGLGHAQAQAFARGSPGFFPKAVVYSLAGSLIGGLLLLLVALWHVLSGDETTGYAFAAAGVCFPALMGMTLWRNARMGQEQYVSVLLLDSTAALMRAAAVIAVVYLFTQPLVAAVAAAMLAPGLINALATYQMVRQVPRDAAAERGALSYGWRTSLYELPALVTQQMDRLILFYFFSPQSLALYMAALRVPSVLQNAMGEAYAVLGPGFARAGRYTKQIARFAKLLSATILIALTLVAVFLLPYVLPLLTGPKYVDAVPYAQILTIGVALGQLGRIQFRFVKSQLDSRTFLFITLIRSGVELTLFASLGLTLGLDGVVAAFVINNACLPIITSLIMRRQDYSAPKANPK
jgi:O-antigen/teichoic acid export membrane protein